MDCFLSVLIKQKKKKKKKNVPYPRIYRPDKVAWSADPYFNLLWSGRVGVYNINFFGRVYLIISINLVDSCGSFERHSQKACEILK